MKCFCLNKIIPVLIVLLNLGITPIVSADMLPITTFDSEYNVYSVAFSHDGTKVVIGSSLWDPYTGEKIFDFGTPVGGAFSWDDEQLIAITGNGLTAILWDIKAGEIVKRFQAADYDIRTGPHQYNTLIFTRDNKSFIAAEFVGQIHLWDIKSGSMKVIGYGSQLKELFITNDGTRLIASQQIISLVNYEILESLTVGSIRLTSDGKKIFYVQNGTITFYDANTMKSVEIIPYDLIYNTVTKFSPDGMYRLVGKNGDTTEPTRLIDLKSQKSIQYFTTAADVKAENAPVVSLVKFSPNGKLVATVSGNKVYIYDISDLTSTIQNAESIGQ